MPRFAQNPFQSSIPLLNRNVPNLIKSRRDVPGHRRPGQKLVKGRSAESVGMTAHMGFDAASRGCSWRCVIQGRCRRRRAQKEGEFVLSGPRFFNQGKTSHGPVASLPALCWKVSRWCRCAVCRAQEYPKCELDRFRNGDLVRVIAMGSPAQNAKSGKFEDWILALGPHVYK